MLFSFYNVVILFIFLMTGAFGAPANSWNPYWDPTYSSQSGQTNFQTPQPNPQPQPQPQPNPQNQPAECVYPNCIPLHQNENL
jgi:hypothetical protein